MKKYKIIAAAFMLLSAAGQVTAAGPDAAEVAKAKESIAVVRSLAHAEERYFSANDYEYTATLSELDVAAGWKAEPDGSVTHDGFNYALADSGTKYYFIVKRIEKNKELYVIYCSKSPGGGIFCKNSSAGYCEAIAPGIKGKVVLEDDKDEDISDIKQVYPKKKQTPAAPPKTDGAKPAPAQAQAAQLESLRAKEAADVLYILAEAEDRYYLVNEKYTPNLRELNLMPFGGKAEPDGSISQGNINYSLADGGSKYYLVAKIRTAINGKVQTNYSIYYELKVMSKGITTVVCGEKDPDCPSCCEAVASRIIAKVVSAKDLGIAK